MNAELSSDSIRELHPMGPCRSISEAAVERGGSGTPMGAPDPMLYISHRRMVEGGA